MAKNPVFTIVDNNGLPISSTPNGDGTSTFGTASSSGGTATAVIAAGVAADTTVKAVPGRLARVLVTATGTNPLLIFDNAAGHTGTVIGALPANPAVGTTYDFQMPAAAGITVQGNAGNPGVTVSYI